MFLVTRGVPNRERNRNAMKELTDSVRRRSVALLSRYANARSARSHGSLFNSRYAHALSRLGLLHLQSHSMTRARWSIYPSLATVVPILPGVDPFTRLPYLITATDETFPEKTTFEEPQCDVPRQLPRRGNLVRTNSPT